MSLFLLRKHLLFSISIIFSHIMKMFSPFLSILGRPPQACSLSLSGFSIGLILLFMPEMWVIIWQLLFLNLSLTYRESNLKTKHHIKGIEAMSSYILVSIQAIYWMFFSVVFLWVFKKIFPFLSQISYIFSVSHHILFCEYLGDLIFIKREKISPPLFCLPESAGSCW